MTYDIGIIGAGIQGAGVAQAAAAAGYRVIVWEQIEVASGTSSRSSKLIHGGLRYLESGQLSLVTKSLAERTLLLRNASSLVKPVSFYIPIYPETTRRSWQIRLGLTLYALLGKLHRYARFKKIHDHSDMQADGLKEGSLQALFQYWDAQTDDVALTKAVMQSAQSLGAELSCPASVLAIKQQQYGYEVTTSHNEKQASYHCRTIVNAAGPWVNHVLDCVQPVATKLAIDLVQGTHIIIDDAAPSGVYYVEAPQDKRAVFVMPWYGRTMIGTTETHFTGNDPGEVKPQQIEIDYLLEVYRHYFPHRTGNLTDAFAGLRVLPKQGEGFFNRPRDTVIHANLLQPGLLTLYGGKLTGYRATAEEVVEKIKEYLPTVERIADTRTLKL